MLSGFWPLPGCKVIPAMVPAIALVADAFLICGLYGRGGITDRRFLSILMSGATEKQYSQKHGRQIARGVRWFEIIRADVKC